MRAFVLEDFQVLSLEEILSLVRENKIYKVHIVNKKNAQFIRSDRNARKEDNLNNRIIHAKKVPDFFKNLKNKFIKFYVLAYAKYLELNYAKDELLYLENIARITKSTIKEKFFPLIQSIENAARENNISSKLLASILVDEVPRSGPDDLFDILGYVGVNTSVGIAQIKVSTLKDLVERKYVKIDKEKKSNKELYKLLSDNVFSTQVAAAHIRSIKDSRKRWKVELKDSAIAEDYSRGASKLDALSRGKSIVDEIMPHIEDLIHEK